MKKLTYLAGITGIFMVFTSTAQAEGRGSLHEFLNSKEPLLKIQTYSTSRGDAHRSFIFGYPVRGDTAFVTESSRDTSKEGYAPQKTK